MLLNCSAGDLLLKVPWTARRSNLDNPKGNQSWISTGRTDAEAEAPILWPPDGKNWLIGKDSDAGKDWKQEEKGTTEDEMVGWHHWLHGHEFEHALGDSEGQGSLACCTPWGCKESDTTDKTDSFFVGVSHSGYIDIWQHSNQVPQGNLTVHFLWGRQFVMFLLQGVAKWGTHIWWTGFNWHWRGTSNLG